MEDYVGAGLLPFPVVGDGRGLKKKQSHVSSDSREAMNKRKYLTISRSLVVVIQHLASSSTATQTLHVGSRHSAWRLVLEELVVESAVWLGAAAGVVEGVAERVWDDIVAVQTVFAGGTSL